MLILPHLPAKKHHKFFLFFSHTLWLASIFVKREICALLSPLLPPFLPHLVAMTVDKPRWFFSLTAHTITKALVLHRKWALISIFRMTSHTQCISSRHWLCHVVPRGELLISPHYHYRSTSRIGSVGNQNQPLLSFVSLYRKSEFPYLQEMVWAAEVHHGSTF